MTSIHWIMYNAVHNEWLGMEEGKIGNFYFYRIHKILLTFIADLGAPPMTIRFHLGWFYFFFILLRSQKSSISIKIVSLHWSFRIMVTIKLLWTKLKIVQLYNMTEISKSFILCKLQIDCLLRKKVLWVALMPQMTRL